MNSNCHETADLNLKPNLSGSLWCAFVFVAIMIYDQKSKVFRKFLRALTADELVTQAARIYACKHHHPILTEKQAAKSCEKEATRMKRIEETHWSSWEDDKPQLYMDAYDLRQQRLAQSQAQPDSDPSGSTWQMSEEDKKEKI